MLKAEDAILSHNTVQIDKLFVTIEIDGQPFRVRVYRAGDTRNKPLVMVCGYNTAVGYSHIFDDLAKKYNTFIIEQGSFGLNTKLASCSGSESPKKAEEWIIDFFD